MPSKFPPAKRRKTTLKLKLLQKSGGKCTYCNKRLTLKRKHHVDKVTVDHYIPLAKGGFDDFHNKVAACLKCNNRKADLMPEEFMEVLKNETE